MQVLRAKMASPLAYFGVQTQASYYSRTIGYGIAPSVISWIESYLRRRSFQVSVNGPLSQAAEAVSGVPQGSEL